MKTGLASRNNVYLRLFHVVWSVFALVFLALILFLSFWTDHDLVRSNVRATLIVHGFCSGFSSLNLHYSCKTYYKYHNLLYPRTIYR